MVQSTTNIKQNAPGSSKASKYFVNHQGQLAEIKLCGAGKLTLLHLLWKEPRFGCLCRVMSSAVYLEITV